MSMGWAPEGGGAEGWNPMSLVLGPDEVRSREMGLRGECVPGVGVGRLWATKVWALSGGPPPMGGGSGVGPQLVDPSMLVGTRGLAPDGWGPGWWAPVVWSRVTMPWAPGCG